MKKRVLLGVLLCAALIPGVASADRMSYAFVQLTGTFGADVDDTQTTLGGTAEGNGIGFAAGWIMGPYAFFDLRYDAYDLDKNVDGYEYNARLGFRNRFPTVVPWRVDGYGMISLEGRNFDNANGTAFDEIGPGLTLGLRVSPADQFEFGGELGYQSLGGHDGLNVQAGVQWNITDFFAANLAYRVEEYGGNGPDVDLDGVRAGIRLQWGGG